MKYLVLFLILSSLSFSCKKSEESKPVTCSDGFIFWGGDPAADGAGWYFSEDRQSPKKQLDRLPASYQMDSTAVHICLYESDRLVSCFCNPNNRPHYFEITEIHKR
jgi:hypothetical protein